MSRRPTDAQVAEQAADDAVKALKFANKAAKEAAQAAAELKPDPRPAIAELIRQERSALLRVVGPRRNRWRDLQAYEERIAEIEQRRARLLEELGGLHAARTSEPDRHTAALADWLAAGEKGDKPASRLEELDRNISESQAEYEALGIQYQRVLQERAEHVTRNSKKMVADIAEAIEKTADEYRRAVDEAEAARRELLALRREQVWAAIFPHQSLANEPNTMSLAGAIKRVQAPLVPNVEVGLIAEQMFSLLRADVGYCASVSTIDQAAAERGVTPRQLTGREASWLNGQPDFVAPTFASTWDRSPEQAEEANKIQRYIEVQRRRLWGDQ